MFPSAAPFPIVSPANSTRSMGLKLLLVCGLALLMSLPAIFISGLVDQRSQAADSAHTTTAKPGSPQTIFGVVHVVDTYRSVDRSLKYAPLFLSLVFLAYFLFEATTRKRVHPAQYLLVGTAQILFYLLLLSIAEHIGFDLAFLIAGTATVALFTVNVEWVFGGRDHTFRALGLFAGVYLLIYLLLRLQDNALLLGSAASFLAVAAAMYLTRRLDWYGTLSPNGAGSSVPPPLPGPSAPPVS